MEERPQRPEEQALPESGTVVSELAPKKISVVGFTESRNLAPWGQEGWELWVCNNLHRFSPPSWHRLYDLHSLEEIRSDSQHDGFLRAAPQKHAEGHDYSLDGRPVYCFDPQPEWPTAVAFPKDRVVARFGRYITNSITWMIFHAVLEMVEAAEGFAEGKVAEFESVTTDPDYHEMVKPGLREALLREYLSRCELHIYGVDMATGTEYSSQRPSCEHALGVVQGLGIQTYIPPQSDLLKVTAMYGAEDDSALYAKATEREAELVKRGQQMEQQVSQGQLALAQIQGALETTRYFKSVWCNPRANRDGSPKGLEDGKTDLVPEAVEKAVA